MARYPIDDFVHGATQYNVDDGIDTFRAIDGSIKTHILYSKTVYDFTAVHYIDQDRYNELMSFYRANVGTTFYMRDPYSDTELEVRFKSRPVVLRRTGDCFIEVSVGIIGNEKVEEDG